MFETQDLVKSAGIYLIAKDKNSKFLHCSENFAEGVGVESPHQLIGKTDFDFFDDSIAMIYRNGDARVLNGGSFINVVEIQPQVNKTIQILTTKNPLRNKSGELVGVVVSFIDITGYGYKPNNEILTYDLESRRYYFQIGTQKEYFTDREYSIFKYTLMGFTAKHIAQKLNLSYRTVEDYISKIKIKLQCDSKFHIAETAHRLGILNQNIFEYLIKEEHRKKPIRQENIS